MVPSASVAGRDHSDGSLQAVVPLQRDLLQFPGGVDGIFVQAVSHYRFESSVQCKLWLSFLRLTCGLWEDPCF